jgi:hypothetical protein
MMHKVEVVDPMLPDRFPESGALPQKIMESDTPLALIRVPGVPQ